LPTFTRAAGPSRPDGKDLILRLPVRFALTLSLFFPLLLCCRPASAQNLLDHSITFHVDGHVTTLGAFNVGGAVVPADVSLAPLRVGAPVTGFITVGPSFGPGRSGQEAVLDIGGVSFVLRPPMVAIGKDLATGIKIASDNVAVGFPNSGVDRVSAVLSLLGDQGTFTIRGIEHTNSPLPFSSGQFEIDGTFTEVDVAPEPPAVNLLGAGLLPLGLLLLRRRRVPLR